jgi:VIT1/CCC1 family predicted Fe2+/Mn2+ transporter
MGLGVLKKKCRPMLGNRRICMDACVKASSPEGVVRWPGINKVRGSYYLFSFFRLFFGFLFGFLIFLPYFILSHYNLILNFILVFISCFVSFFKHSSCEKKLKVVQKMSRVQNNVQIVRKNVNYV